MRVPKITEPTAAHTEPRSVYAERLLRRLLPLVQSPVVTWIIIAFFLLNVVFLLPKCLSGWFVMVDAHVYARAAQNVWRHEPIYPLTPTGDIRTPDGLEPMPFLYSPFFAAMLGPLGWMGTENIVRVFFVLGFASFWGIAAALAWIVNRRLNWRGVLGAGFILFMTPGAYFNLTSGQIEGFLQLLFVLAMVGVAPGILLALSLLVKPFAAWPLAIMALRQPRRIILPTALALLLGLAVGVLVCGASSYPQWMHYSQTTMYGLIFGNMNTSLSLLPLRLMGYTALPSWGRMFLMGMFALFPGLVAWVMRRRPPEIQASWVAAAALIFAPFSHEYYLPLLVVPIAFELRGILNQMAAAGDEETGGAS